MEKLDYIFSKGKLSLDMQACEPMITIEREIKLKNARHPLMDRSICVPLQFEMGGETKGIVITGPNTGGKTVTLKTVGLLTLMAECGLHIPAGDGSCISTFKYILADIGDEQSIAQSLSTFSGHMRTIVDIISQCDERCLILFDELGAGTDPAEGAALAIALIEFCRKAGCKVVATTHYAELKLYAMRTQNVVNASCEFNIETLQPTYKLLIGVPGRSNAFAISRKLGLSEDIIKSASDLLSQSDKDFEDVLNQLENQRQQMEAARIEAESLRKETKRIKDQNEEYAKQLQLEHDKALSQARKEAQTIIENARRTANQVFDELKSMKKQLAESAETAGLNQRQADLRRNLNNAEEGLRQQREETRPAPTREIIVGDTVELLKLGTKANVIAINKDGTYQLQAGILKLNAASDEIYLLENENKVNVKQRPAHSGKTFNAAIIANEVDLRGMDSIEAICVLERYMDEAMRSNHKTVRIIHGKGTGTLRTAVHQTLRKNRFVKSFRLGVYGEGEDGVTIAEFS